MRRAFLVILVAFALTGCNDKKEPAPTPAIRDLSYASATGAPLVYHAFYMQDIDIKGETPIRGERAFNTTYMLQPESQATDPAETSVTLQDFAASLNMTHTHRVLDTHHLRGKNLVLAVDPKGGQPRQLSGLPRLDLGETSGGKLDPGFLIEYSFPRLPPGAPQTGDTWEETVRGPRLAGNLQIDASVTTVHRYAGIEEINQVPCVKIESSSTGRLKGSQKQMGEQWDYSGTLEGTATWYFEPESGYLVRYNGSESTQGTATAAGVSASISQETQIGVVHVPGA